MSILSKRLIVNDLWRSTDVLFELDPHKLLVRDIKWTKTVVMKEFEFDEIEFCFHKYKKKEWKVELIDNDDNKYYYILKNENDKNILHKYFKKHSVKWYNVNDLSRYKTEPSKEPGDMTEDELREEMFSSLGRVPVEYPDGSIEYVYSYYKIDDNEHCLIVRNGKTYHTRVGCFKNWKPEQQKKFNGWIYTTVETARSMGMRKCSFCDEADNKPEETIEDFLKWLDDEENMDD